MNNCCSSHWGPWQYPVKQTGQVGRCSPDRLLAHLVPRAQSHSRCLDTTQRVATHWMPHCRIWQESRVKDLFVVVGEICGIYKQENLKLHIKNQSIITCCCSRQKKLVWKIGFISDYFDKQLILTSKYFQRQTS